jgi:hypothetical protein
MVDASVPGPSTGAPDATPLVRRRDALGTWAGGAVCRSQRSRPADVKVSRAGAAGGAPALLQGGAEADLVNLKSLQRPSRSLVGREGASRNALTIVTWLILPVVICLSQRLSHACLSISNYTAKLRMAHYISYRLFDNTLLLG